MRHLCAGRAFELDFGNDFVEFGALFLQDFLDASDAFLCERDFSVLAGGFVEVFDAESKVFFVVHALRDVCEDLAEEDVGSELDFALDLVLFLHVVLEDLDNARVRER